MSIMCNGRVFTTSPWMAQQAEDFKKLVPSTMSKYGIKFYVHGDGLIPHIAKELGCHTDGDTDLSVWWRGFKRKTKAVWKYV